MAALCTQFAMQPGGLQHGTQQLQDLKDTNKCHFATADNGYCSVPGVPTKVSLRAGAPLFQLLAVPRSQRTRRGGTPAAGLLLSSTFPSFMSLYAILDECKYSRALTNWCRK